MLCWYYSAVADAMSESIRTVWDWEIGGDRYYYEMPAFDSVHAECEDIRKILPGCQQMASIPTGVEKLTTISLTWVGCTNVTDRQTTNDRRTMTYSKHELEFTFGNKKLISRWDSERELSLRRHCTRTKNTIDSCINCATDPFLQRKFTKFSDITQCNGHYAVKGHSRSPILLTIESSYTTSY